MDIVSDGLARIVNKFCNKDGLNKQELYNQNNFDISRYSK